MKTTGIWHAVAQAPARSAGRPNAHATVEPVAAIGKATRADDGSRHYGARLGRQLLPPPRTRIETGRDLRFLAQILGQRMEPAPAARHRAGVASYPSLDLRPETAAAEETVLLTPVGGPPAIDVLA